METKEQIREIILSYGADICGFAHIDRFAAAPRGFTPADLYGECKAVISFGLALPHGLSKVNPRLIYGHYSDKSCEETDTIAFKSAKKIEQLFAGHAIPVPCDTPYEYWDSGKMEGRGLLSMRHVAVQAGLGSIGKNTLFVNRRFGSMLTLGAILTDLELPSDALSESVCIAACRKCVDSCPAQALGEGAVDQKLCREHTYGQNERGFATVDCNKCRTVCPLNYQGAH
jgi:epoxyqueuosine reductase QueG